MLYLTLWEEHVILMDVAKDSAWSLCTFCVVYVDRRLLIFWCLSFSPRGRWCTTLHSTHDNRLKCTSPLIEVQPGWRDCCNHFKLSSIRNRPADALMLNQPLDLKPATFSGKPEIIKTLQHQTFSVVLLAVIDRLVPVPSSNDIYIVQWTLMARNIFSHYSHSLLVNWQGWSRAWSILHLLIEYPILSFKHVLSKIEICSKFHQLKLKIELKAEGHRQTMTISSITDMNIQQANASRPSEGKMGLSVN
jgi:hypothetical protein